MNTETSVGLSMKEQQDIPTRVNPFGEIRVHSPDGDVDLLLVVDPTTNGVFGVDASYVDQVEDRVCSPYTNVGGVLIIEGFSPVDERKKEKEETERLANEPSTAPPEARAEGADKWDNKRIISDMVRRLCGHELTTKYSRDPEELHILIERLDWIVRCVSNDRELAEDYVTGRIKFGDIVELMKKDRRIYINRDANYE